MSDRIMSRAERERRHQCPECGTVWEDPSESACPVCKKREAEDDDD